MSCEQYLEVSHITVILFEMLINLQLGRGVNTNLCIFNQIRSYGRICMIKVLVQRFVYDKSNDVSKTVLK